MDTKRPSIPLSELAASLTSEYAGAEFKPYAFYNEEGDALEIHVAPGEYVANRLDTLFTVFTSLNNSDKVLGLAIKNFKKHDLGKFSDGGKVFCEVGRARIRVKVLALKAMLQAELRAVPDFSNEKEKDEGSRRLRKITPVLEKIGDREVEFDSDSILV